MKVRAIYREAENKRLDDAASLYTTWIAFEQTNGDTDLLYQALYKYQMWIQKQTIAMQTSVANTSQSEKRPLEQSPQPDRKRTKQSAGTVEPPVNKAPENVPITDYRVVSK